MKKVIFTFHVLLLLCSAINAQNLEWVNEYPHTDTDMEEPRAFKLLRLADGSLLQYGAIEDSVDVDGGSGTLWATPQNGDDDIILFASDTNGNYLWHIVFGGDGYDESASYATQGANGNIVITGQYSGTCDFDPGPGTQLSTALDGTDPFVASFTSTGAFVTAAGFDALGNATIINPLVNSLGDIIVAFSLDSTIDVDPSANDEWVTKIDGNSTMAIVTLTSTLLYKYAEKIGESGTSYLTSIGVDTSNNVCITGYFRSAFLDIDPSSYVEYLVNPSPYTSQAFVARYDLYFNFLNGIALGNLGSDHANIVKIRPGSLDLIISYSHSEGVLDVAPGLYDTLYLSNAYDTTSAFYSVICYGPFFNVKWARAFSHNSNYTLYGMEITGGEVAVWQSFINNFDADPGQDTAILQCPMSEVRSAVTFIDPSTGDFTGSFYIPSQTTAEYYFHGVVNTPTHFYVSAELINTMDVDINLPDSTVQVPQNGSMYTIIAYDNALITSVEKEPGIEFSVYPNPANDIIYIEPLHVNEQGTVTIINTAGNIVRSMQINFGDEPVIMHVNDLTTGLYAVSLQVADQYITRKFIKY